MINEVEFLTVLFLLFFVFPLNIVLLEIAIGNLIIYLNQKAETKKQFNEWMEGMN